MSRRIDLEPVTRIAGAMRITINLDGAGNVQNAHADALEFRGFEGFLRGRHLTRVPFITPRVCGLCHVAHHLVAGKAFENGLGVEPAETVQMLRELLLVCEHVGNQMLHIILLGGADFALDDLPPEERGLVTLYERDPELVRALVSVRDVMHRIISTLAVQAVHATSWVPGGITKHLSEEQRLRFLREVRQARDTILRFVDEVTIPALDRALPAYEGLGSLNTFFVGLVKDGALELYDGRARVIDPAGRAVGEFGPRDYQAFVGEDVLDHSYAKAAYVKLPEQHQATYRVGPIARINVADTVTTDRARAYVERFRAVFGPVAQQTMALNYARAIAAVHAIERAEQLLADERIAGEPPPPPRVDYAEGEGVGMLEAPRGLLIHHYQWDEGGYVTMAEIITPTNGNAHAIDNSLEEVAARSIRQGQIDEAQLENDVGVAIRAYDPCLPCATHAHGGRPFDIQIVDSQGNQWSLGSGT